MSGRQHRLCGYFTSCTQQKRRKQNDFFKFTLNVFIHAVSFSLFYKLYKQRNTENRMTYINIDKMFPFRQYYLLVY